MFSFVFPALGYSFRACPASSWSLARKHRKYRTVVPWPWSLARKHHNYRTAATGALKLAARARSVPQEHSKELLEPLRCAPGRSKELLEPPLGAPGRSK